MATDTAERPGIEEMYETASNTSDLTLQLDPDLPGGAADVLIAAAWSETRLGGALLRLHSEWSASEKPAKPTKERVKAMVGTYQVALLDEAPLEPGEKRQPLSTAQATHYAAAWYAREQAMLLQKLKQLPAVREQVTIQAVKWGMGRSSDPVTRSDITQQREHDGAALDRWRKVVKETTDETAKALAQAQLNALVVEVDARRRAEHRDEFRRAEGKATEVIRYWLDTNCGTCDGRKFRLIAGTPSLSNKLCPACGGSGVASVPHGQEGRRLANHMDQCVHRARQGIRNHLRGARK